MGRTRRRPNKTTLAMSKMTQAIHDPIPSVPALLQKAQMLLSQCDYPLALRFIQRVLEMDQSNLEAQEMKGIAEIESGDVDSAKLTFQNLAQHPHPPASAYLYLAQLSEDDPHLALSNYQSAIDILQSKLRVKGKHLANQTDDDVESDVRSTIVRALIGMVEIWMDPNYDLCFDPAAENTCEGLLNTALQTDPGNAEALQSLASVRMSQQRPEDAKTCLEQAWLHWKDLDPDDLRIPPLPTRLSLVKLFLEVGMYTPALNVLHGIIASDDQDVEAWYLEGWCFFLMAEEAQGRDGELSEDGQNVNWEELAKNARDSLETCQILHDSQNHPDAPLLDHVRELIEQIEAMGIKPCSVAEDGEGEEEKWDDVDSDGDDIQME